MLAKTTHVLVQQSDQLGVACVDGTVWHSPLEWHELLVIHFEVVLAKLLLRSFFRVSDSGVLKRSEHSGRDVDVVGQNFETAEKATRKQHAGFDGNGSKFQAIWMGRDYSNS